MIIEGPDFSYNLYEEHFIKYFNRLFEVGHSYNDIEYKTLPQIQKYYNDIVVPHQDVISRFRGKTLKSLFDDWKDYNKFIYGYQKEKI